MSNEVKILAKGPAGTRFAGLVEQCQRSGSRFPFMAAVASNPKAYDAFRRELESVGTKSEQKTRLKTAPSDEASITHPLAEAHAEVRRINRLSASERPKSILKLAQTNPKAYSEARSRGLI